MTHLNRREFLKRAGALAGAGALAPLALNLSMLSEAAAATGGSDYKAIVCIYLNGGNDNHNTIVPYDSFSYGLYANHRQTLATSRERLDATALATRFDGGRQMALAPELAGLKSLYDQQKLAILGNIGPLIVPTNKDQFRTNSVPLPPRLASHNDQSNIWLSGTPEGAKNGWGGRMGDLLLSQNSQQSLTCIQVGGSRIFLSGQDAQGFYTGTGDPVRLLRGANYAFGSEYLADLRALMVAPQSLHMAGAIADLSKRSLDMSDSLYAALTTQPNLNTVFDDKNNLAQQLKSVARMVSARNQLGNRRQVFIVSIGGFDLHDNLNRDHPALLKQINDAMLSFNGALTEMGVNDQVVTFTASEFGRTLSSNGNGSDHGWGGHHFLMGGDVLGGQLYGNLPLPELNGPNDIGQGRLIPTLAVDQLGWALAKWFGVAESDRNWVMPNAGNFDPLACMRA